jgi:hypothetical protein
LRKAFGEARQSAAQVFHCDRHPSPSSALNHSASLDGVPSLWK